MLFGTLFEPGSAPLVPDIVPYWHNPAWAAGVIVVDALNWAGADADLPQRWRHLSEWPQQLLRAYLFRLGLHLVHRHSAASAYDKLLHTGVVIADFVANSTSVEPAVVPSTEPPAAEITVDEGADSSAHLDVSPEPTSWEDTAEFPEVGDAWEGAPDSSASADPELQTGEDATSPEHH